MKDVVVLMSTYNGEKYIEQQIYSILAQKKVNVQLIIRDDGSNDHTVEIIEKIISDNSNICLYKGTNIGYIASFMWLVKNAPISEDTFYSFSDQDDVWNENKLISAIKCLEGTGIKDEPLLYYSDLNVVDENLKFIKKANNWEGSINKYMFSVFIGIRGCTMVFNYTLEKLLQKYEPSTIYGHDTFIALLAFWAGHVVYDPNAYINYRQTGSNLSITGTSKLDSIKKNLVFFKKRLDVKANMHEINAQRILEFFNEDIKGKDELRKVADYRKSMKDKITLLKSNEFFKDFSKEIRLFNFLLIVLGKL